MPSNTDGGGEGLHPNPADHEPLNDQSTCVLEYLKSRISDILTLLLPSMLLISGSTEVTQHVQSLINLGARPLLSLTHFKATL